MSEIMIRCPETGSEISTGIGCNSETFAQLPFVISHANCPLCARQHTWSKAEAWLSGARSVGVTSSGTAVGARCENTVTGVTMPRRT